MWVYPGTGSISANSALFVGFAVGKHVGILSFNWLVVCSGIARRSTTSPVRHVSEKSEHVSRVTLDGVLMDVADQGDRKARCSPLWTTAVSTISRWVLAKDIPGYH